MTMNSFADASQEQEQRTAKDSRHSHGSAIPAPVISRLTVIDTGCTATRRAPRCARDTDRGQGAADNSLRFRHKPASARSR